MPETCMTWIHNSMRDNVTYELENVSNFLEGLLHIEEKKENKISNTIQSVDIEEIDLNNSTSSIEHVEDVETNYLNHFETGEDTLPDDEVVVNLNSSTSGECNWKRFDDKGCPK